MQPAPGPPVYSGRFDPPVGSVPVVRETGIGSGPQWEAYKKMKGYADSVYEGIVHREDGLNPGGGGCRWEPGASPNNAICTPSNGGHETLSTNSNGINSRAKQYKP